MLRIAFNVNVRSRGTFSLSAKESFITSNGTVWPIYEMIVHFRSHEIVKESQMRYQKPDTAPLRELEPKCHPQDRPDSLSPHRMAATFQLSLPSVCVSMPETCGERTGKCTQLVSDSIGLSFDNMDLRSVEQLKQPLVSMPIFAANCSIIGSMPRDSNVSEEDRA